MRPVVHAHRGSSAAYAEHTRAACVQALLDGADGVECDVHLTRDGHPVLHHDTQLGRTSNGRGPSARARWPSCAASTGPPGRAWTSR